jgi:drug/metabolite transporter (DMT)-like permease
MTAIYIALSVLCSTGIFVVFKLFEKLEVNTRKAIVANYLVAAVFGLALFGSLQAAIEIPGKSWFWLSCVLGSLFISLFYLMATIAQKIGVATASVASKMSVVIPVIAAVLIYNDSFSSLKIIGIVLALAGLYLATQKGKTVIRDPKLLWLPVILFFGSGLLDTLLKLAENKFVPPEDQLLFIPSIFMMAFVFGFLFTTIQAFRNKNFKVESRSVIGGIFLGIINYGSIYFIWNALAQPAAESSMVFPVANMGVVAASALAGLALFKEQLTIKNWLGIIICVGSIAIIAFS